MSRAPLLLLLLAACNATGSVDPNPADPAAAPIVRPRQVTAIQLAVQRMPLPTELAAGNLALATLEGTGTLVGGPGGLYELTGNGLSLVDPAPVSALAAVAGAGIVVASAEQASIWNGTLQPSQLGKALDGTAVTALFDDGQALWIGSALGLDRFQDGALTRFATMPAPVRLDAHKDGSDLVVTRSDGAIEVIRKDSGYTRQTVAEPGELDELVPGDGQRLIGRAGDALLERVALDGELATWRPMAVEATETAPGATGIQALVVDPGTGFVWAILADTLLRIDGDRVDTLPRPEAITLRQAFASPDGALWLASESELVRVGNEGPPVTWSAQIESFNQNNCQRCHAPLGVGHALDSYELWVGDMDRIILALEAGRMPQDGRALVGGSIELVRRWQADGLRR